VVSTRALQDGAAIIRRGEARLRRERGASAEAGGAAA
jgi:hypothetical protein